MRTREEINNKLKEHSCDTPSKWREKAEWRMTNKSCHVLGLVEQVETCGQAYHVYLSDAL